MYYMITKRSLNTFTASTILGKQNRQKCMQKFKSMSIKQGTKETKRKAAVLIPLIVTEDEVSLLYTLRAASLKSHRGQVSFPGGMHDVTDKSLEDTALRETEEELGINPKDVQIWGSGNPIIRQDLAVIPVVGCISLKTPIAQLAVNHHEVEDLFTVKLQELCDPKLNSHTQFRKTYSTPTYLGGPYRIWGLTAVMTFMFLKALVPNQSYKHHVPYIPDIAPNTNQELPNLDGKL